MRCFVVSIGRWLGAFVLVLAFQCTAPAAERAQPLVLTNLLQLRHWASHELTNVHPFRIVADVFDADLANGVLALRDSSGVEFISGDFRDSGIRPGATISLEGDDCAVRLKSFGLALAPGLLLVNEGATGQKPESSTVFLHAGRNPLNVQWFNHLGRASLNVEYEGPGLQRQPIAPSAISRLSMDPATRATNFVAGLNYRCYEGPFDSLPEFSSLRAVRTGIVTNLDLNVRTRAENVALDFEGFLDLPRDGVYTFYMSSDDGSRLRVGKPSVQIRVLTNRPAPLITKLPAAAERNKDLFITLEGTVEFSGAGANGGEMQFRVGNDRIRTDIFAPGDVPPPLVPHTKVQVSGVYHDIVMEDGSRAPGILRVCSWNRVQAVARTDELIPGNDVEKSAASGVKTATNILTTVADIKSLTPEMAGKALPVSIRGVVIARLSGSAVVQDSTRGIYVYLPGTVGDDSLRRGEMFQVDGVTTPGLFAPSIIARRITRLGSGQFPAPVRATWDQLLNGSLDTEYAELEGVVAAAEGQGIELLADGGKVTVNLNDFRPERLASYVNALVRIRGCVFARFNQFTHKLEPGSLRMGDASIEVVEPARADVFAVPRRSIAQLLLYDPKATPFRLLKINGQVIHSRPGACYLTDGTNGVYVTTRTNETFSVGDLVDAAGFLDVSGPVAELKEAVARKVGDGPLPAPIVLNSNRLLQASSAGRWVRLKATLMNHWIDGAEHVLDLQAGFLAFRGRLPVRDNPITFPPSGSHLELTGVYAAEGMRLSDGKVSGFELLLNSPANIRVLARPPWWNLKRVLILAGILGALLCVVLIWNKELHRKVEERTVQLEQETRSRQRAELQRAAEAERSRIARDLHDELGAGLTEVSLIASTGLSDARGQQDGNDRFGTIAEKAGALVSRLDVIVWAIDPTHNSLQSFADYVSSYAKEFFAASEVVCRLKIPIECEAIALGGSARHNLFLAVKESLNNVIRHAGATEVELQLIYRDRRLEIIIADNGRGFARASVGRGHGLANLEQRLAALQGECRIESEPGKGTRISLIVPLTGDAE